MANVFQKQDIKNKNGSKKTSNIQKQSQVNTCDAVLYTNVQTIILEELTRNQLPAGIPKTCDRDPGVGPRTRDSRVRRCAGIPEKLDRDLGVGHSTRDPGVGPWGETLWWDHRVGPWGGTLE